jgi:mono/diheme cytochrome c family protein
MSNLPRRALVGASAVCAALLAVAADTSAAEKAAGYFGYGTAPSAEQITGWSIAVRPDGQGLPAGRGSVEEGANIYAEQCAGCHGIFGEGTARYPKLAGGGKLTEDRPEPTVGNYWPYATTLWDYINRAMPFPAPRTLTPNQVYAITAYVLNLNDIVPSDFVADRNSLPKVQMPNRDGFNWTDPRPDTKNSACMSNCVDPANVKILSTAEGKDLTPRTTGPLDDMRPK